MARTKHSEPAHHAADEDGMVYPVPDTSGAPHSAKLVRHGEISRLDREHDFEPVAGSNPIAEIRAAEAKEPHYGEGLPD